MPAEGAKTTGVAAADRIVVRAARCPWDPASVLAKRFRILRSGMRVGAFVAAVEEAGGTRREALAMLHLFHERDAIGFVAEQ